MECVLQLQLQAWTVLWEMRCPFPHGASQQWVQISQGKVKNPESLAVLRPHHSHLCHMGQCQPHLKTPAQASVGGLGYVCLQAAVLQPPPCVAPGTKPEQAQVDRNRFACHANKTRSCICQHTPCSWGCVGKFCMMHWAPTGPQALGDWPSPSVFFKMGSNTAPDWHFESLGTLFIPASCKRNLTSILFPSWFTPKLVQLEECIWKPALVPDTRQLCYQQGRKTRWLPPRFELAGSSKATRREKRPVEETARATSSTAVQAGVLHFWDVSRP